MSKTLFLVILSTVLMACSNDGASRKKTLQKQQAALSIPDFNADSAYYFVEKQTLFGPRVPGSEAHVDCGAWLASTLTAHADTVIIQNFKARRYDGANLKGRNIIASFAPEEKRRVVLAAHWDSRFVADYDPDESMHDSPIDGANDGASGVGVLLELARNFSTEKPPYGIDIILFDLEDQGPPKSWTGRHKDEYWGLGAQYWSNNPHRLGYRAQYGILLDMVGAENAVFPKEYFSRTYAGFLIEKVWAQARVLGYGDLFVDEDGPAINDDHFFVNTVAKIPMIDIIHLDQSSNNSSFFEHWHTTRDNMDHISTETLDAVGTVIMHVVYRR